MVKEDFIGKVIFKHLKEGIEPRGCLGENIPGRGSNCAKASDRNVSGVSEKWQGDANRHCNPWKALEWCLTHSKPGINVVFVVIIIVTNFFSLSSLPISGASAR